jgi:hypothetical protein
MANGKHNNGSIVRQLMTIAGYFSGVLVGFNGFHNIQ